MATHEGEHCSTLKNKLPSLQDNLITLTVWRWAETEAASPLRAEERGDSGAGDGMGGVPS